MSFVHAVNEIVFVSVCRAGRTISDSKLVQNTQMNKESVVKFWPNWRKYGAVVYFVGYSFFINKAIKEIKVKCTVIKILDLFCQWKYEKKLSNIHCKKKGNLAKLLIYLTITLMFSNVRGFNKITNLKFKSWTESNQ